MRTLVTSLAVAAATLTVATADAIVPAPRTLGIGDSGKTVTIVAGQEVRIKLTTCPSCGYHWSTVLKPNAVVLTRLRQLTGDSTCAGKPGCAGGTNKTTFRWKGRTAGVTKLELAYFPPGKNDPAKSFTLTVRVRKR
jgi:predicted secreted protein